MARIESGQHRFTLNNGTGEIPALGFGTPLSDRTKTREATKAAVEAGFAISTPPSGTATKKRSARRSRVCSPTEQFAARTCS